ncbi:hypothetical protein GGI25_005573 [Coemansia spiralis]|uniref:Uncharacterized protein n=2 Tax=Coemansia TaxID=4863 RepID=A0A9W8KW05_9FUNG|nr:hypothetical protein EDC05_005642 [Coemansia umbellata]KAJ2619454.1 hypothetical protein GGI26_005819 [Coemansia sp. RSA 1358]KAJ2671208.1 hypothetical protein GGI25_005573 [Coemansia spiralis]
MGKDAAAGPSELVRRVKGDNRLVGSQGRFRMEEYSRLIKDMGWRDLGVLLAKLTKQLEENTMADQPQNVDTMVRCLAALAGAVMHMLTVARNTREFDAAGEITSVNAKFVTKMFAAMATRASHICQSSASAFLPIAYPVLRSIASALRIDDSETVSSQLADAFDPGSVLSGITYASDESQKQHRSKRRRVADNGADTAPHEQASTGFGYPVDILRVLAFVLKDPAQTAAHKHAIRILRAQNNHIIKTLGGQQDCMDMEDLCALQELCHALIIRGCGVLKDKDENSKSDTYIGDLFACIRDILPLVRLDSSVKQTDEGICSLSLLAADIAAMCKLLLTVFKALALCTFGKQSMYPIFARMRHRCYQWAALCRATTWITIYGFKDASSAGDYTDFYAEGGRICWLQIIDSEPVANNNLPIWLLLLSESLAHIALSFPQSHTPNHVQPLFLRSEESQIRVFSAIASLLASFAQHFDKIHRNESLRFLLLSCIATCERLLLKMKPSAASMGLFWIYNMNSLIPDNDDTFNCHKSTPLQYIFRPPPLNSSTEVPNINDKWAEELQKGNLKDAYSMFTRKSDQPNGGADRLDDLARLSREETVHENKIAGVFAALDTLLEISSDPSNKAATKTFVVAFRTTLMWIRMFATGARNNVGRQMRILENLPRSSNWLNSENLVLYKPATDWARLQRIPVASNRQTTESTKIDSVDSEPDTYKPMVARVLRFFAAIAAWCFLKDEREATIVRCLGNEAPDAALANSDARNSYSRCKCLETLLTKKEFDKTAFSSLQILSSILGVRSHWQSSDIGQLRLPHVQVRDRSPPSSEALIQLAMQMGICNVMLDPQLLAYYIEAVHSGKLQQGTRAFSSIQIWLDMIGNVVRHSLFRSYLGGLSGSAGADTSRRAAGLGPASQKSFLLWWRMALAASAWCLLDILGSANMNAERLRLALVMPSHLASWQQHLPATESALKGFFKLQSSTSSDKHLSKLYGWLESLLHLPGARSSSVLHIVYFFACRLWLSLPLLDYKHSELQNAVLHISRDVWGIAAELLQLLMRMLHQPVVHKLFVESRLVCEFSNILVQVVAKTGIPNAISDILSIGAKVNIPSPQPITTEDSDMITIPFFESDLQIEECISDCDVMASSLDHADLEENVFDKLLRETTESAKLDHKQQQQQLEEYYKPTMQAELWTNYMDQLLRLPAIILFCRTTGEHIDGKMPVRSNGHVDMEMWLRDPDETLFQLFTPLLSVRNHLSTPSTLWDSLYSEFSANSIVQTLKAATASDFSKMAVSAAFLISDLTLVKRDGDQTVVSIMLERLVHGLISSDSERNINALLFLAWRHQGSIFRRAAACAKQLELRASMMLEEMAEYPNSISPDINYRRISAQETDDLSSASLNLDGGNFYRSNKAYNTIALCGYDMDSIAQQPVEIKVDFLIDQSPVFRAMLTGNFLEAQAVGKGVRMLVLQNEHFAVVGIISILHMCVTQEQHLKTIAARLESKYTSDELARILLLAIYYDVQPVIVLLVWHFAGRIGEGQLAADDALLVLAVVYRDKLFRFFDETNSVAHDAASKSLGALVLLCLDQVNMVDTIGDDVEAFVQTIQFLFSANLK